MIDSHLHTHYSHGTAEVFEMVETAIKKGLTDIAFAEHFHYDYFNDLGLPMVGGRFVEGTVFDKFKLYYQAVKRAKEYYQDKINIRVGVEVDYLPEKEKEIKNALEIRPFVNDYQFKNSQEVFEFDFVMGSVHFIGKPLKYFSDYLEKGEYWLIDEYFNLIKKSISSNLFNVIGHPELIKYFIKLTDKDYVKYLEEIINLLIKHNVAIDVNTDYLKDSKTGEILTERINPGIEMLKMCQEKGVPLILGSDAHKPEKIANNFIAAIDLLKSLGVKKMFYFKNKQLIDYKI